ncbi:putative flagellar assembly protein H [Inovirus sp.]|nr:putative flagellar assembly protein H [Inovirus sp.]
MKKKIDPLFALSVLVLVLGIFALACSWVPFQSQCSESNIVARADAVASVTPENFSWGVDSNNAVVHIRGNPVICAVAVPAYSLFENLSGVCSINFTLGASSFGSIVVGVGPAESGGITGVPGQYCYAVFYSSDEKSYALSYTVQSAYFGDANNWAAMNNVGIRFNKLDDYSIYSVSATSDSLSLQDLFWTIDYSGIGSGTQAQWVALLDAFLRPSYASAVYFIQGALSGEIEQLETEKADLQNQLTLLQTKYNTLQSDYDDLQKKYQDLFNSVSFSRVISGFPADSFYTTKHLDAVSYNGSAATVESGGIVTFGGKVISSSDGFVSVSYTPTQSEPLVPYFKFMAFKLPSDYEYSTAFVLQNVSFTYGPVYVGYADLVGSYTFDTQVSSVGMLDNVIELGQLEQGKDFYFNLPKAFSNQSVLLFYSKADFGVSTSMVLSRVTPINEKVYDSGFVAGQDSMLGAIENARQQGFAEAQKMFDNGNTDYSFFGLISAVIDAPIKAIRGLLNFDILGVNMFSFVTSLFSLAVVLMIVKLLLGTRDVV